MTTDDSPTPKFRRRAEARPDEILDAARDLFSAQGYAHCSVDQIAKAAGVSKGAVYLYFPSKRAILEALVKRAVVPISAEALAGMPQAVGNLRATLTFFLRMIAQKLADPNIFAVPRIVIREAAVVPEIAEMYREAVLEPAMPVLIGIIKAGVASGELRPIDPELTLRTIMGPMILHMLMSEVFGITPARGLAMSELIENHLEILTNGLFAQAEGSHND